MVTRGLRSILMAALATMSLGASAGEGDPVAGKAIFALCAVCHTLEAGGADLVGPNLHGVFGKASGTNRQGFAYSAALQAAAILWDDTTIDAWIRNPVGVVPATKMEFVGLTKRDKRENLIAYLKEATK
jgi:cytochrome c